MMASSKVDEVEGPGAVPAPEDVLHLPFDEYQRYRVVADIIDAFRKTRETFTVLDVGSGGRETLGMFLPLDRITYLDKELPEGYEEKENFILGDITTIRLEASYDFVVSIDTLEHIPPEHRKRFLDELLQAPRMATIIAAPFDTEGVAKCESLAREAFKRTHGYEYRWLEEHFENSLPSLSRTKEHIEASGLEHIVIPNGALDRWSKIISVFLLTEGLPQFSEELVSLFEFYNRTFYPLDNVRPAYRQVIVINKRERPPDLVQLLSTDSDPEDIRVKSKMLDSRIAEIHSLYKASSDELIRFLTKKVNENQGDIDQLNERIKQAVTDVDLLQRINLQNQKRIDELSGGGGAKIEERNKVIEERNKTIKEKNKTIKEKNKTIIEKNTLIKEMRIVISENNAKLKELENESLLASRIKEKDVLIKYREARLRDIEDTITVRSLRRFQRSERIVLPPGSRRWRLYSSWFHWMRRVLLKPKETTLVESLEEPPEILMKYFGTHENVADIICFPIIDWHFRYQRSQQLLSRFAKNGYRVFYLTVELEPLSKEYFVREIEENVIEVHLSVPSPFNVYSDTLTEGQLLSLLNSFYRLREDFNIDKALSFVEFPSWEPIVFRLKDIYGWKVLYDCMDEHSGFSNTDESIIQEEEALIGNSDLVISTSAHLQRKVEKERDDALLIPNAGDFQHFCRTFEKGPLSNIKKPVIGYYGAIAEWFDSGLVEFLASERPDWSFVLIGHTFGSDIGRLETFPNVHFLGEKPYLELPNYLCGFDVCIIPFRLTPLIEATHPVKFYEYLAAGKPVVSTMLPELVPFKDMCYLANDKEEFLKNIKRALDEKGSIQKKKRMVFAKEHTWDVRYAVLESHVQRLFPQRER